MKIIVLDGHALDPGDLRWDGVQRFGSLSIFDRTASEEEAIQRIGDAEIVLTNKTPITASLLDACPSIRLICVLATGYNVVDCDAARSRGIPVCNVPSYGTDAVAQFTIGLLLELCHRIGYHDSLVHNGTWTSCPDFSFWRTPQMELAGKTMGIVGLGRIGTSVARIANALGMTVVAYSRSHREDVPAYIRYVSLEELLRSSDVVSLHCPLTDETTHIINEDTISLMKDGAILLNTSRGPLIDDHAVAEALKRGKLRGAAVDVVKKEPIPMNDPLLTAPNCIITPHMAWAPLESRRRLLSCVEANIAAFLTGDPQNVVNG